MKFEDKITYEVPMGKKLVEEFKMAAQVSEDGKTVTLGDLTARNNLSGKVCAIFAGAWEDNAWNVTSENRQDLLHGKIIIRPDLDGIIHVMAEHEARKNMPESAKEQALADALEEKARQIRSRGVSFGS